MDTLQASESSSGEASSGPVVHGMNMKASVLLVRRC